MGDCSLVVSTGDPVAGLAEAFRRPAGPGPHGPDVVDVTTSAGGTTTWHLRFRGRPLRWEQRGSPVPGGVAFEQVEGDFAAFSGSWRVDGPLVRIEYSFRTSVAHLAGAVDPVVARVLLRTALAGVTAACRALGAGDVTVVEGGEQLSDLPPDVLVRS